MNKIIAIMLFNYKKMIQSKTSKILIGILILFTTVISVGSYIISQNDFFEVELQVSFSGNIEQERQDIILDELNKLGGYNFSNEELEQKIEIKVSDTGDYIITYTNIDDFDIDSIHSNLETIILTPYIVEIQGELPQVVQEDALNLETNNSGNVETEEEIPKDVLKDGVSGLSMFILYFLSIALGAALLTSIANEKIEKTEDSIASQSSIEKLILGKILSILLYILTLIIIIGTLLLIYSLIFIFMNLEGDFVAVDTVNITQNILSDNNIGLLTLIYVFILFIITLMNYILPYIYQGLKVEGTADMQNASMIPVLITVVMFFAKMFITGNDNIITDILVYVPIISSWNLMIEVIIGADISILQHIYVLATNILVFIIFFKLIKKLIRK